VKEREALNPSKGIACMSRGWPMPKEKDLRCNVSEARSICLRTIDHITDLCADSIHILIGAKKGEDIQLVRGAYVLTLLALEETGKLFRIWQTAAAAERQVSDQVIVSGLFGYHGMKGALAGDLCCQMLAHVARTMESNDTAQESAPNGFRSAVGEARRHLEKVYLDFSTVRETVMYIANDGGASWNGISREVAGNIVTETVLLSIVANGAKMYLASGGDFSVATKALVDISNGVRSPEYYEFTGRMIEGIANGLRESPGT
jgi:hypothetical protein